MGGGILKAASLLAQQPKQAGKAEDLTQLLPTEIKYIGEAEAKQVPANARRFDPSMQPVVYWHDTDWKIDLIVRAAESEPDSLSINSSDGSNRIVELPDSFAEIESIRRVPGDKAIVVADLNGDSMSFAIIDLKLGKVIDDIGTFAPTISPNGRFILYDNWFPPHAESGTNEFYHLYDTLKSPGKMYAATLKTIPSMSN